MTTLIGWDHMARKVQVLLVDDLDGTELGQDGETVTFGMGGERYEIDLSHGNAAKFREYMGKYVTAARNVTRQGGGRGHTTGRRSNVGTSSSETKAARAWLIEHGHLSADSRGRISADNWERYRNRGQLQMESATGDAGSAASKLSMDEAGGASEKAPASSRGNSRKAEKASAGTSGTPETAEPVTASA